MITSYRKKRLAVMSIPQSGKDRTILSSCKDDLKASMVAWVFARSASTEICSAVSFSSFSSSLASSLRESSILSSHFLTVSLSNIVSELLSETNSYGNNKDVKKNKRVYLPRNLLQ